MRHDQLLDTYLAALKAEVSTRTHQKYGLILRRAHRETPYGIVAAADHEIQTWLWGQDCGPAYRAQQDAAIRHLHRWLRRRGITNLDPTEFLPRPKQQRGLPRPVPRDQVTIILTHAREPERTWCHIGLLAGARCCEIAGLDTSRDITTAGMRLLGKGGKERLVPVHPQLAPVLDRLEPGPVAQIQAADLAGAISRRIGRECRRLATLLGVPQLATVTAHRLRHTIATELLDGSGDLRLVQDFLGHATPSTTAIYTRVVIGRMASAVAALPGWEPS